MEDAKRYRDTGFLPHFIVDRLRPDELDIYDRGLRPDSQPSPPVITRESAAKRELIELTMQSDFFQYVYVQAMAAYVALLDQKKADDCEKKDVTVEKEADNECGKRTVEHEEMEDGNEQEKRRKTE